VIAVFVLSLPWLWWSRAIPRTHENYGARLRPSVVIENWGRLSVILAEFLNQVWTWSRWSGLWVLLLLAAVLGHRGLRRRYVMALWMILVAQLALYVLIFVVTPWDARELLASALDRLLLQTISLVVLLIGFHWSEMERSRT
jgi:hypothetical protein